MNMSSSVHMIHFSYSVTFIVQLVTLVRRLQSDVPLLPAARQAASAGTLPDGRPERGPGGLHGGARDRAAAVLHQRHADVQGQR